MQDLRRTRAGWAAYLMCGLALLTPSVSRADALTGYSLQILTQVGQAMDDFTPHNFLFVSQLNDRGQLILITTDTKGNQVLGQWSGGRFTPIAAAGGAAPGGKTWPKGMGFVTPLHMNTAGSFAFTPTGSNGAPLGVYLWDAAQQSVIPVAEAGTAAVNELVFAKGGNSAYGWINNQGEVALLAFVKPVGGAGRTGLFLRHADGQLQAVALPGDPLPGEAMSVKEPSDVSLNDAGLIAFDDVGSANIPRSGFLWENGKITSTAEAGTVVPNFGTLSNSYTDGLNNKNRNVWIVAATEEHPNVYGVFFAQDGQLLPIIFAGQELPGGGTFVSDAWDWSPANEVGQCPFVSHIKENGVTKTAAYVIQTDGSISLIVKSGMTTDLGTINKISPRLSGGGSGGIGINSQGQVVLTAKFDNGPDAVVLLTPKAP